MNNDKEEIAAQILRLTGWKVKPARIHIITDTTDWMSISRGDILRLENCDFIIKGNMHEQRFGIDDQPKYWVFSAISIETGEEKIIKAVFNEEFYTHIGILKIRCYRSPEKEGQVLELVKNDPRFMHGYTCYDEKRNNVRVIDYIRGESLFHHIPLIPKKHEVYFQEDLPGILHKLFEMFEGINLLHENGLCHGDVRNDHIIIESGSGNYRWIDFDLKQDVKDFDLWSFGNIINYAAAKGIITFSQIFKSNEYSQDIKDSLSAEDSSAFYNYRLMNLKKIFQYIPEKLALLLKHFTMPPIKYYSEFREFYEDYGDMLDKEFPLNKVNES